MRRLFVRRSLTAVGIYASVALGFLGTVVATQEFNSTRVFGDYATVIFATGFLLLAIMTDWPFSASRISFERLVFAYLAKDIS